MAATLIIRVCPPAGSALPTEEANCSRPPPRISTRLWSILRARQWICGDYCRFIASSSRRPPLLEPHQPEQEQREDHHRRHRLTEAQRPVEGRADDAVDHLNVDPVDEQRRQPEFLERRSPPTAHPDPRPRVRTRNQAADKAEPDKEEGRRARPVACFGID